MKSTSIRFGAFLCFAVLTGSSCFASDPPKVIELSLALKKEKVPVELHIYPTVGHGYGLRRTKELVTTWPDRVADWLRARGLLETK